MAGGGSRVPKGTALTGRGLAGRQGLLARFKGLTPNSGPAGQKVQGGSSISISISVTIIIIVIIIISSSSRIISIIIIISLNKNKNKNKNKSKYNTSTNTNNPTSRLNRSTSFL